MEQHYVRLLAIGATSVAATFLGLQVGQLWLSVLEAVRVRNGHISVFRAASYTVWTHHHVAALYLTGIVLFCVAAFLCHRHAVRNLVRHAAMFTGTMLAAMFTDVYIEHAIGYVVVAAMLIVFYRGVSRDEGNADVHEPEGILLR